MNRDTMKGRWKQLKGRVKERWGALTNDDLARIDGEREALLGAMQERYGWARERAENELDSFLKGSRSDEPSSTATSKKKTGSTRRGTTRPPA